MISMLSLTVSFGFIYLLGDFIQSFETQKYDKEKHMKEIDKLLSDNNKFYRGEKNDKYI